MFSADLQLRDAGQQDAVFLRFLAHIGSVTILKKNSDLFASKPSTDPHLNTVKWKSDPGC